MIALSGVRNSWLMVARKRERAAAARFRGVAGIGRARSGGAAPGGR